MKKKKHKRRYRRKKLIPEEERERRRILAEERKERKKREKWRIVAEATAITLIIIIFFTLFITFAILSEKLFLTFLKVASVITIILFDESGIRSYIFRKYPDNFIFAEKLKGHDANRATMMQIASTVNWLMFDIMLFSESRIYPVIWLISVIVGIYYMFTREEYSLEKGAKYEGTAIFLIITPSFVLWKLLYNVRITRGYIVFIGIFTVVSVIIYGIIVDNGNRRYTRIIYGIIVLALVSSSGFMVINKYIDFSEPQEHEVVIEEKDYTSGRSRSYYIYVEDWTNPNRQIDVHIDYDTYHELEEGDEVTVVSYKGALGAEHYTYKK